jgi:glycosyltransferase involved in cell wall biosynthesis
MAGKEIHQTHMSSGLIVVSCAGSFERNASVLRALAVAHWYQVRGELQCVALAKTKPNEDLAAKFGLEDHPLSTGWYRSLLVYLWWNPGHHVTVHLVNASLQNAVLALLSLLTGGRIIADWDEWASKIPAPPARKLMWRLVEEWMFLTADTFLVASRFLQMELQAKGGLARVLYIPYGYDAKQAVTELAPGSLPPGRRYLAYVGSFTANYAADIAELFRAALAAEKAGLELLIIGDGELLPGLREQLDKAGTSVRFLGKMPPSLVDSWLAHPQIAAGFLPLETTRQNLARCPNKLFHYIRALLPVVTSRIGEASEALGEHGCYYEFGDSHGLQQAISRAATRRPRYEQKRYTWEARFTALASQQAHKNEFCVVI